MSAMQTSDTTARAPTPQLQSDSKPTKRDSPSHGHLRLLKFLHVQPQPCSARLFRSDVRKAVIAQLRTPPS